MSALIESALQWSQARDLPIDAQDVPELAEMVEALRIALRQDWAASDMMQTCEPFGQVLRSLAPEPFPDVLVEARSPSQDSECQVRSSLAAIEQRQPGKSAWMHVDADAALAEARSLDEEQRHGKWRGPLHGMPVGIKDMFDMQGRTAGWGTPLRARSPQAHADATVVTRLRDAGAVILGTQQMAEFAMSPTGWNETYGPGRNPWDLDRVSGGSSSGAAMSVAAGHVPLAIGSDTGGSIRLPAALCGLTGLKPTQYRVSAAGAMPLSASLDCIGPLAWSAELCGYAYQAIAGRDPADLSCLDAPVTLGAAPRRMKVAVPRWDDGDPISDAMRHALDEAQRVWRDAGVECVMVQSPYATLQQASVLASVVLAVEAAALHQRWLRQFGNAYGHQVRRRISRGLLVSGVDYYDALRLRHAFLRRYLRDIQGDADALMLPSTPDVAPLVAPTQHADQARLEREFALLSIWTRGINYLGSPVLNLPAGQGAGGLPLGMQLVGPPLGEDRVLALGRRYQQFTEWHQRRPAAWTASSHRDRQATATEDTK
ncbi:amidase [Bordetella genomosp. 4]|uniref:Amidase n=1 Tax=Bordetella genomosp. 4 TaxID=463044 RepID=A0A261UCV6_9BORD|nr:amidase [Bordetella genomosp. 4]OZI52510.1 amidase [Bordetella genomosp. 4]OZI59337.1 amidase [Bordetella genomosp. 4]